MPAISRPTTRRWMAGLQEAEEESGIDAFIVNCRRELTSEQ